jgi:hypothetical protein
LIGISEDIPMRRGRNYKKVLITLDEDCIALIEKYRGWGTNGSAHVRRCILSYERGRRPVVSQESPEELAISYD